MRFIFYVTHKFLEACTVSQKTEKFMGKQIWASCNVYIRPIRNPSHNLGAESQCENATEISWGRLPIRPLYLLNYNSAKKSQASSYEEVNQSRYYISSDDGRTSFL